MNKELEEIFKNDDVIKLQEYILKIADSPHWTRTKMLNVAASYGSLEIIKFLLNNGFQGDVEALISAMRMNHVQVFNCLLDSGLSINNITKNKTTLLHEVVYGMYFKDCIEWIDFLLEKGLKLEDKDINGNTVLHHAVRTGARDYRIIEYLLKKGADIHAKNMRGATALHILIEESPHAKEIEYARLNEMAILIVKSFLERGANVSCEDNAGCLPMHYAVKVGSLSIIKELLKYGAKINDKNSKGDTVLHTISMLNDTDAEIVKFLLNYPGVNINQQNSVGSTPLYASVFCGNITNLHLLLEKGVYFDTLLNDGRDIFSLRSPNERIHFILKAAEKLLNSASGGPNFSNLPDTIKKTFNILCLGINARQIKSGNTALHLAILYNQDEVIKLLLEQGANVLIENEQKKSALDLLRQYYSSDFDFLCEANCLALAQIEAALKFQRMHFEMSQDFIIKKESKEVKELKNTSEKELLLLENRKLSEEGKKCIMDFQSHVFKMKNKKKSHEMLFAVVEQLSKKGNGLFYPDKAYQILFSFVKVVNRSKEDFKKANKMMAHLLISNPIVFEEEEIGETFKPMLLQTEQNGQKPVENQSSKVHRLLSTVEHILHGKSEHEQTLGKHMAEFLYESGSSLAELLKLRGNTVAMQLDLIQAFKKQVELSKKREKELNAQIEKKKILEDKLKKAEMEKKGLDEQLNKIKGQKHS